ncbi:MAG: hypothetical protein WCA22_16720 [Candidatus Binatus sp.]
MVPERHWLKRLKEPEPCPIAKLAADATSEFLSEIYGWFTEGFDTADLKDAKALFDELKDN